MQIRSYWLGALLFVVMNGFSQEKAATDLSTVSRLSFLMPGLSFETGTGKNQSLYCQGYMASSFSLSYSDALGSDFYIRFDPALKIEYRYYYNTAKRLRRGKRTAMNSMNYIAPVLETVFTKNAILSNQLGEDRRRLANTIGLLWGMQRNYNSRFSLDLNLGLGYLFTKGTEETSGVRSTVHVSQLTPMVQLVLGFWLNKRK